MKRVFLAVIACTLLSSGMAFAQSGEKGYTDDVYYHASQAEQDAENATDATQEQYDSSEDYYNSSGSTIEGYSSNNHVYNQNAYDSDGYIDYDDDYTSRIRRFYYPMTSVSYWGGVYNPFWSYPYHSWYTPGIAFSYGWNPYWASGWYGYGYAPYYSSFYNPYYGYGWGGYNMGYWNGYYTGLYNGGYWGENNPHSRRYTYAPRGSRQSGTVRNVGNYGVNSRTSPINRTNNTVSPQRGNVRNVEKNNSRVSRIDNGATHTTERGQVKLGKTRIYNNNAPVGRNNTSTADLSRRATTTASPAQRQSRPSGVINNTSRRSQRSETTRSSRRSYSPPPQRSSRTTQPARSHYTPSRSTRSYSSPARSQAPSRSSSSGSVRTGRR